MEFIWLACGVDAAVRSDGEERLLAAGQLDGPQGGQRLAHGGHLDFGALDAAQLAAVVMAPAVDLATTDGRPALGPVFRVTADRNVPKTNATIESLLLASFASF